MVSITSTISKKSAMDDTGTTAEAAHPPGIMVEIVGIEKGDRGRSCEEHDVCGEVVEEDTLLHLGREQILVDVNSLPAIGAHECQVFEKLLWGLVSSTIFVRC